MKANMGKRQIWVITVGCFLSYFLFGLIDNMKGQTLPALMDDVGCGYSIGGTIVFSEYTGFFIAAFIAGILADYFGKKSTLIIAGVCLTTGVAGYAGSTSLIMMSWFIFLIGLGLGMLELGGSNMISGIHDTKKTGYYLNLLNAFYGVGAVLTPVAAGAMLDSGLSWRKVYRISLAVIIPVLLYFILMKCPDEERTGKTAGGVRMGEVIRHISRKEVWMMFVFIFAYVAAEIAVATWFVEFLRTEKGVGGVQSAVCFSGYFVLMMAGRLAGSLFVDRVGHLRSLMIFTVAAIVCLSLGALGKAWMTWMLVFVGFGFSVIFPTATAIVSKIPSESPGTMLGIFFACGGLGGMAGPWLVGIVNEMFGLKSGMMVNVGYCVVMLMILIYLYRENNKKQQ